MKKPICVITGAGGDICSQLAKRLSDKYSIALIGRTQATLEKVLSGLKEGDHNIYQCDITNETSITETVKNIVNNQGNPSVLINGAAAFGDPKKIHEYTNEEINEIINTNLGGTSKMTKEILPWMIKNGGGNIITIGSTCYNGPYSKRLLYAATKRALQSFTETNAVDYSKENIKSNYIFPGPTEGDRVNDVIQKRIGGSKKDIKSMEASYGKINGGELLKVNDTVNAIEMTLNGELSIPSGATLGIDNFGIFDESHSMFTSKNTNEHEFIEDKKRKYLLQRSELSSTLKNKKNKTLLIELLKKSLRISKYAAIFLICLLGSKSMKFDQKIEKSFADFKEWKYKTRDFDYEFKSIAREKYSINNPEELLNKANETQEWETLDLYMKIGQEALENIQEYSKKGYTITGINLNQSLDI